MESMTAVGVLGVIAFIGAIVAWMTWHRGADERQSVQHHQHTLETLRHVADRRPPSVWTGPGRRSSAAKDRPISRPWPTPPARRASGGLRNPTGASTKVGARRRAMVAFTDDVARAPGGEGRGGDAPLSRRMGARLPGTAERARRDGRARVRRARFVAGAAVIVVVGVVWGALALGGSHHLARTASRVGEHRVRPLTAAGGASPTTTAVSSELTAAGATAFSARYAAPSSTYTVAVHASAQCWVMATDPLTGKVVWTGTIAAGAAQSVDVSGSLHVQLGAPTDANVTLDGRLVQLPANFRSPFTLEFGPAP
jgi:hypothetical protein